MLPQEIIRAKRNGQVLSDEAVHIIIAGLVDGRVSEGQAAAFAMAVFFRGMNGPECVALTEAMTRSGTIIDWAPLDLPGPILDKHSTGGIGDNVSLILAPAVAACGAFVPMISGRGLGHTGGTLDKLDAIPGYRSRPDLDLFQKTVRDVGCAIIGQTADLAPADGRLYAIRDVTATVESIPLITASILSKKRAAGLQGLVMDVKTGSGAFMATMDEAEVLARSLRDVAIGAGLPTSVLITDMNEPLASAAGNAVEVANAVAFLTNARRDPRLHAIVLALGADMLLLGGLADTMEDARRKIEAALTTGGAADVFERMVAALGGPADFLGRAEAYLPAAPVIRDIPAGRDGFVAAIDTRAVGLAVVALGGGRARAGDPIDPSVGFSALAGLGMAVSVGAPIGRVHAQDADMAEAAAAALRSAYRIAEKPPASSPPVHARLPFKETA